MKEGPIYLREAIPGDIGLVEGKFGKVISYPTPKDLVTVELRSFQNILRDKTIEEISGSKAFLRFLIVEAKDASIFNPEESPEEYLTVSGRIVRVLKKKEHFISIFSLVTGSQLDVNPTYPLISISRNKLSEIVKNLKQQDESWKTDRKSVSSKPKQKAARRGGIMTKTGEPKAPSRRQVILNLLKNGVNGTPIADIGEVTRLVKEKFPEHTEKNIRNAVSVAKWHLFGKGAKPAAASE